VNPFIFPGHPVHLFYYYFWYMMCSLVDQLGGSFVTARAAVQAGAIFSGLAVFAAITAYAEFFGPFVAQGRRLRTGVAIALVTITGLDLLPWIFEDFMFRVFGKGDGAGLSIEWWNEQVTAWLGAVVMSPHHPVGMAICFSSLLLAVAAAWKTTGRDRIWAGRFALCDVCVRSRACDLDLRGVFARLAEIRLADCDRGCDCRIPVFAVRYGTAQRLSVRQVAHCADDSRLYAGGLLAAFNSAFSETAAGRSRGASADFPAGQLFPGTGLLFRMRGVLLALAALGTTSAWSGGNFAGVPGDRQHRDLHVPPFHLSMERSGMAGISGRAVRFASLGRSGCDGPARKTGDRGVAFAATGSLGLRVDWVRRYRGRTGQHAN
jgi:hypothetical protein